MYYEKNIKILVISNNPFSKTNNNGKTLASFFKNPKFEVSQLYFSDEKPTDNYYKNFYKISDRDILNKFLKNENTSSNITNNTNSYTTKINIKKSNFSRLIREVLWKITKWKSVDLIRWLDEINPDIIFFCAGDSIFAYRIFNFILNRYNSKSIIYVTDDYILPRRTVNMFWWIRRNLVFRSLKNSLDLSDLFIVISEKMRSKYRDIFGKDSIVMINATKINKIENLESKSNILNFVYAGGLNFNRYKTLSLISEAISKNNAYSDKKAYLKIFSGTILEEEQLKKIEIEGASKFYGFLNEKELEAELNKADVLIHVESFEKKIIESTRLSVSTKISEYISLCKPILSVGPDCIASMEYLSDCALCITNASNVYKEINMLINDDELLSKLTDDVAKKNDKVIKHGPIEIMHDNIIGLYEGNLED